MQRGDLAGLETAAGPFLHLENEEEEEEEENKKIQRFSRNKKTIDADNIRPCGATLLSISIYSLFLLLCVFVSLIPSQSIIYFVLFFVKK